MTVRVETLDAPASSLLAIAADRLATAATTLVTRWWQRPTGLIMSDDWLHDHARSVFKGRAC